MKTKSILLLVATAVVFSYTADAASYTAVNGIGTSASGIYDEATLANPIGRAFRRGTTPGDAFTGTNGGTSAGPGVIGFGIFSTDTLSGLNATQLVAAFTGFGGTVDFNAAGTGGSRSIFTNAQGSTVTGSVFDTKNVYLFAGNGTTFANSTQFMVAKSSFLFAAADDAIPTPIELLIRPSNSTLLFGTLAANLPTTSTDAVTTQGWNMVTAVPEPSAALLGALGALGLLRRRRN